MPCSWCLAMWKSITTGEDVTATTLLIDAHCVMCNGLAKFLRKRAAPSAELTIQGIQSEEGQALIATFPQRLQTMDTLYVVRNAALFPVAWLVPLPLRDAVYWGVSKIRHRFGRMDD